MLCNFERRPTTVIVIAGVLWKLLTFGCSASAEGVRRPLVFIPGMVGSVLKDKDGRVVWGDAWSLTRLNVLTIPDGPKDPVDG
ncbi:hypothetical protein B0G76_7472 [Paraburkholderia sp. BL23I1N1]|nr:hypothetical protein B0G76_7472 [Paraburkholderia sp. BL23I1N1]